MRNSPRDFWAQTNREVLLGRGVETEQDYYIPLDDLMQTSVHIVGAAGYGKSFYLRHLIDQFVTLKQSFGLVDPHTELFEYALWRLRREGTPPEKLVIVDPGDTNYAVGFNPLACGIDDAGEAASMVLEAFLKAWGARSFDETPRLEGILRGMFRLLIENGLTLLEGYDFLNVDNVMFRRALWEGVGDEMLRKQWQEIDKLHKNDKLALFESSRNRLHRLVQAESMRMMLAQRTNTVNFTHVMDDGRYLLANLGGVAPENQRLLGALLINGIFHAAKRRNSRHRRPWALICDEFGEFATRDFANSLDQLRKFGVHPLVLGHQRLAQLEREDRDVLSAVMTNAKVKVVFGGLERVEAERMARELYTGDVSGDRVKHRSMQTKFRPVMDTFVVETHSESDTDSMSDSCGSSDGSSSGTSESEEWERDTYMAGDRTVGRHTSGSSSTSESSSHGSSSTRGYSRSVVPITRNEEFLEESSRQFYSLEEEWERRIGHVHGRPKREALIRIYNNPVIHVRTPEIRREEVDERLDRYRVSALERCPQVKTIDAVVVEIEDRRKQLTAMAESSETAGRPFNVKSFRE